MGFSVAILRPNKTVLMIKIILSLILIGSVSIVSGQKFADDLALLKKRAAEFCSLERLLIEKNNKSKCWKDDPSSFAFFYVDVNEPLQKNDLVSGDFLYLVVGFSAAILRPVMVVKAVTT